MKVKLSVFALIILCVVLVLQQKTKSNSNEKMENICEKSGSEISAVAEYMLELNYTSVRSFSTENSHETLYVSEKGQVGTTTTIDDQLILGYVQQLFDKFDCQGIYKDGNYVFLQFLSTRDTGQGILYSLKTPPNEFSTADSLYTVNELTLDNFYYFLCESK
jgi:hypothetical protein